MRPDDFFIDDDFVPGVGIPGHHLDVDLLDRVRRSPLRGADDIEVGVGLARLIHDDLEKFGTGGGEQLTEEQMRAGIRALVAVVGRLGITELSMPFRDFATFRSWWLKRGASGSYQARRDLLHEIFEPVHDKLAQLEERSIASTLADPVSPRGRTGWAGVDTEISELRRHFQSARTAQDYRAVGLDCVAVIEALSAHCYDPARHLRAGETEPPVSNTKQRLDRCVEDASSGSQNTAVRKLARAIIELAQEVKHSATPTAARCRPRGRCRHPIGQYAPSSVRSGTVGIPRYARAAMSYFESHSASVRPHWATAGPGLRKGQLGAAWALASHFTTATSAAQGILPTGVGKTAIMTLLPFLLPTRRVLVITPSRLVRDQVVSAFSRLDVLTKAKVVPWEMPTPSVGSINKRLSDADAWTDLEQYDVVVGTPHVLSPAYSSVVPGPLGLFDLLIVDEAHHSPAETWKAILEHFSDARRVLLTATPFRDDRLHLPGEQVYNYPLRLAIAEGVYSPISFVPVEADDPDQADRLVAETAVRRLRSPEHLAAGSALLVRTHLTSEARTLVSLYSQLGLELGLVTGNQTLKQVRATLKALEEGAIHGLVSVSVLGEGFDLPRLKVAAYHRPHRSLAATLQFVGRISRVSEDHPVRPELVAVRRDVQDETRELYQEDASWADLIPDLSEAAVEEERLSRQYLASFSEPSPREVSMHAVAPGRQAVIYELGGARVTLAVNPTTVARAPVILRELDQSGDLLLLITRRVAHPTWMRSPVLDAPEYSLHLVVRCEAAGWLFVSSPTEAATMEILDLIGAPALRLAPAAALNKLLWGVNITGYSSIGMRSAYAAGGHVARYQVLAGQAVQDAVDPAAAGLYGVGHLIGRHEDERGRRRVIGVSTGKSKVWSADYVSLREFKDWCWDMAAQLSASGPESATVPLLEMMMPARLDEFPPNPIAALVDSALIDAMIRVRMPSGQPVDLGRIELVPVLLNATLCEIQLWYNGETLALQMDLDARVTSPVGVTPPMALIPGRGWIELAELFSEFPPSLHFADGSLSRGGNLWRPRAAPPPVRDGVLRRWNWDGCQITAEVVATLPDLRSVQDHTASMLQDEYPDSILVRDHGAGEIADLVLITELAGEVVVALVHCKASGEEKPGLRVGDLHDVCGQAVRAVRFAPPGVLWSELAKRLAVRGATAILNGPDGAEDTIRSWQGSPPPTRIQVWVVQPGLEVAGVARAPSCTALLGGCDSWLGVQGLDFVTIGS